MILSNYSYMYDLVHIANARINTPNVMQEKVNTVNVRLIGSRLSAKTIQALKFVFELGYQTKLKVATDI